MIRSRIQLSVESMFEKYKEMLDAYSLESDDIEAVYLAERPANCYTQVILTSVKDSERLRQMRVDFSYMQDELPEIKGTEFCGSKEDLEKRFPVSVVKVA